MRIWTKSFFSETTNFAKRKPCMNTGEPLILFYTVAFWILNQHKTNNLIFLFTACHVLNSYLYVKFITKCYSIYTPKKWFSFWEFNTIFINVSVILWRSVLFVEKTNELHQDVDKLYQIKLYDVNHKN
jgi:hypothetical protein